MSYQQGQQPQSPYGQPQSGQLPWNQQPPSQFGQPPQQQPPMQPFPPQQPYNPPYGNHHVPPHPGQPPSPIHTGQFPPPAFYNQPTQGNPGQLLPLSYPPYSYPQPQMPSNQLQDPPFEPHKYRGWVLAALVISYIVSMSLFVPYSIASNTVEETGNHFSGGAAFFLTGLYVIGTLLFLLGLISTWVIDWKGFTTLNGLINWRRITGGKRFWLICAFVFVFEVMHAIYLIRAVRAYSQYTQQKPTAQLRGCWQRYKSASRKVQVILASGILLLSFGYCSSMAVAIHTANTLSLTATPSQTPLSQPVQTNTNGTPLPTAASPTIKPTPTHPPKWTTVQTFQGNGTKKTTLFTVPDSWRLVWSCDPSSFDGSYNLIVDVKGSDGSNVDPGAVNTICKAGNTGDSTQEYQGGNLYLDVASEAVWTIQVQVLK